MHPAKPGREQLLPPFLPTGQAILFALRELTHLDTAPTPQAWRKLLALPPKPGA
jgi:hypothetical protein